MNETDSPVAANEVPLRLARVTSSDVFLIEHEQYYLEEISTILLAVVAVRDSSGNLDIIISGKVGALRDWLKRHRPDTGNLHDLSGELEAPIIGLNRPIGLEPVYIAKPWGQEIWYTGIEKRGQSRISDGRFQMPLPWLLALGREFLLDDTGAEPNLLKILDPLGEEVFGDLYFELHEKKREVYVVTAVDTKAWPSGRGAIRYGFNQALRRRIGDDARFRREYLAAVRQYEAVRRDIDELLDRERRKRNIDLNEPVDAETVKSWLAEVPAPLRDREERAREEMNRFTHLHPLYTGDVVKVSCLTPHALQHGVRTVEFQTPVYERKILNFAQKVLTQDHWDTEEAVSIMHLDNHLPMDLVVLEHSEMFTLERVVMFSDFQALRLTLAPGGRFPLVLGNHYWIAMAIEGEIAVGSRLLGPETAVLVPRTAREGTLENRQDRRAVCLLSHPVGKSL